MSSAPVFKGGSGPAKQAVAVPRGPAPLNPERPPQLLGKYAKLIGKEIDELVVKYSPAGVSVGVKLPLKEGEKEGKWITLPEFHELKKKAVQPSADEKLRAFRNKYELRLNAEFPKDAITDITEESIDSKIQGFIEGLEFKKRRALLMTQKQFASAYPNGFTQA